MAAEFSYSSDVSKAFDKEVQVINMDTVHLSIGGIPLVVRRGAGVGWGRGMGGRGQQHVRWVLHLCRQVFLCVVGSGQAEG